MRVLAWIGLMGLLLGSCSTNRLIDLHRTELEAALSPTYSLAEKRDAIGESTIEMMHQTVDRLNPKQGLKYLQAYAKTNGPILDRLVAQLNEGQKSMTDLQRITFVMGLINEPYAKDAASLVPRFIKRYEQIQAAEKMVGSLKSAFGAENFNLLGS